MARFSVHLAASLAVGLAAHADAAATCGALAAAGSAGLRIGSTREAAAGAGLPAHCIVTGVAAPRPGGGVGFELRLPAGWNGRLLFQGGGGLDGVVKPATGPLPLHGSRARPGALARGYAVVSMDGGHQGEGADFAADPEAWRDFAYASAPKVTRVAKELVRRHYGKPAAYSYFMGCSNGGREAMMAAERDPREFDGVVAANPGFNLSASAYEEVWETAVLAEAAPVVAQALTDADLALVADSVLARCDAADGLADGLVFNHACRFEPASIQCTPGQDAGTCLAPAKAALVRKLFDGSPHYASWPYDPGIVSPAWRKQKLGTSPDARADSSNAVRGAEAWYRVILRQPVPDPFPSVREVEATAQLAHDSAKLFNVDAAAMGAFAARGGKLILLQGMSDPVFSATDLVRWYHRASQVPASRPWLRMFLSPGMGHCGGGPGLDDTDPLTAIEAWVEEGVEPKHLAARGSAFPAVERPLCAYPAYARHDAGSFRCVSP